jgi:hypothetical protein
MLTPNRILLQHTLFKHHTLALTAMGKQEMPGLAPNKHHLQLLLDKLQQQSFLVKRSDALACSYTITCKGIAEGIRLKSL